MTTTIRKSDGHPATVELVKQGLTPLWNVGLVTGTGRARTVEPVGRIMRAASDLWYSEDGHGWDEHPTRKHALITLADHANR